MKMVKKILAVSGVMAAFLLAASYAVTYAQQDINLGNLNVGQASNVTSLGSISQLIVNILNWFFGIVLAVSVAMLLYAGFLYMTAAGSDDKLKKAKKTLTWAIIGIVIALLSKSIVLLIQNIFGYSGSL